MRDDAFAFIGLVFAALAAWLGLRIVNRRENWAKRATIVLAFSPVLYVLSFGPACWIASHTRAARGIVSAVYHPVIRCWANGPRPISNALEWWMYLHRSSEWAWFNDDPDRFDWINV